MNDDIKLIYIETTDIISDVRGSTRFGEILETFTKDDQTYHKVLLKSDARGAIYTEYAVVSKNNILSNRSMKDINPKIFYASLPYSTKNDNEKSMLVSYPVIEYPIKASFFNIKFKYSLEQTSNSGLGSGIYGFYENSNMNSYEILCEDAYLIQDREHGESFTIASLQTNRLIDSCILFFNDKEFTENQIELFFVSKEFDDLVTLWSIVFLRTNNEIKTNEFHKVISQYSHNYLTKNELFDSINGDAIQELPVNHILGLIGKNGVIGDDSYSNSWDRGCVLYDYSKFASFLVGGTAYY